MYASSGSSQMKTNKSRNCPIKRERMERLKRRMATYRERSNYQRKLQIWREENLQKNEDAVGFNLFCKEFEPSDKNNNKNTLSSAEVLEFNESYFETCSSSVHPTDHFQTKESCLCWICGGMFQSKNQLRQHAVDDHFSDWLASMTLFELDEMLKLRYISIVLH